MLSDDELTRCGCATWVTPDERVGEVCESCGWSVCIDTGTRAHDGFRPARGAPCSRCHEAATRKTGAARPIARPGGPQRRDSRGAKDTVAREPRGRVTMRQRRQFRDRPTVWAPIAANLAEQLAQLGPSVERVYVLGERPVEMLEWAKAAPLPDGWEHGGHYLHGATPVYRARHMDGRHLEVHRAAVWLGESDATAEEGEAALAVVAERVGAAFDDGRLLATPSATGRYLLLRSIPFDREWPVLDDELQQLIRSTSGQGRIELFTDELPDELPQLVQYDGRFMYGALCWGLPGGVPTRDTSPDYAGYQRGRYRVRFTVPKGWTGPGLLGVKDGRDGWRWPRQPGQRGTTWADGAEVGLALAQGWRVTILERLLWPDYRGRGPLDTWADKLGTIRGQLVHENPRVAELARAAIRSIVLQTIGALHGREHRVTRIGDSAEQVPESAALTWRVEGDAHVWSESRGQGWAELAHPEWSAAIWARARARLLDAPTGTRERRAGALHLPDGCQLVAFRTDALYLTADPRWPDDGKAGRFRQVAARRGPFPTPESHAALLALRVEKG